MRVLVIASNLSSEFRAILDHGSIAMSAYLKREGHAVRVVHLQRQKHLRVLKEAFTDFRPEVVGITSTVTETAHIPTFVGMAKAYDPGVPVVVGGTYATVAAEKILEHPGVDAVCRGEGEGAFLEYLERWASRAPVEDIRNLWFKRDGEILRNQARPLIEDLDSLPYMDREAVDCQGILDQNGGTMVTVVGRGFCPYECNFCVNHGLKAAAGKGTFVRTRSVENALGDLERMGRTFNFKTINFRDDNISVNRDWVLEFCEKYPRRFSWPFDCFARCDTLDLDQMKGLKDAGCQHVYLGMESGNDRIRREVLNKHFKNEQMIEVVDHLNRLGIKAVVSNIIGLPYETPEDFRDTVEVNRRIHSGQLVFSLSYGAAPKLFIYNPFPGTRLYDLCVEKGWLNRVPSRYRIYRDSYVEMPQFPRKEIYRLYSRFRYDVYKDSHPFFAWLFRFYDMRPVRLFVESLPSAWFSRMHQFFSGISRRMRPKSAAPGPDR